MTTTTTGGAAIGGGRIFSLMSITVLAVEVGTVQQQRGNSMTTHMYNAPEVHTGSLFWFCSFGFGWQLVLPYVGAQDNCTTGEDREEGGPRHSRPAEKFVLVASDINIFGTLPNWQGKLFVRPTDRPTNQPASQRRAIGLFLVRVRAASRRCCGKDGTSCSGSSSDRHRSCSVSIRTVVLWKPSSAEAVLPCPHECCMPLRHSVQWNGGMQMRWILPARRLRSWSIFRPPPQYVPGTAITALATNPRISSAHFRRHCSTRFWFSFSSLDFLIRVQIVPDFGTATSLCGGGDDTKEWRKMWRCWLAG